MSYLEKSFWQKLELIVKRTILREIIFYVSFLFFFLVQRVAGSCRDGKIKDNEIFENQSRLGGP